MLSEISCWRITERGYLDKNVLYCVVNFSLNPDKQFSIWVCFPCTMEIHRLLSFFHVRNPMRNTCRPI